MKHVYKQGGAWKTKDGKGYTAKCINDSDLNTYLNDGWVKNLDDAFAIEAEYTPVETSDYESELREKIKALGGKPSGRAKIETLEKQLSELEDDSKE